MVHEYATPTARQQKREATYERIIRAAMAALAEGGLDSLTIKQLAKDLGFAVGALYRYFPSKDAIIVAVQRRIVETIREEVGDALQRADDHLARSRTVDPRQAALLRLWVMVCTYQVMAKDRPTEFGLLSMTLGDPRQLVKDVDAGLLLPSMAALLQLVGSLFVAAEKAGALDPGDPARRTVVIWTSVQGALQLRKLERFGVGVPGAAAVLEEAVSTLLRGWGADPSEVKAMQRRARRVLDSDASAKGEH